MTFKEKIKDESMKNKKLLLTIFSILAVGAVGVTLGSAFIGLTVIGTVTDASTGQPIPGAFVNIVASDGSFGANTVADANGSYNFSVPTCCIIYNVTASSNGFQTNSTSIDVVFPSPIIVNFALVPYIITGTVTDNRTGSPLADVGMSASFGDGCLNPSPSSVCLHTTTNTLGKYSFILGPPVSSTAGTIGNWAIKADAEFTLGYQPQTTSIGITTSGPTTYFVDFPLDPFTISGKVLDANTGQPLKATVQAFGTTLGPVTTDSTGSYSIGPVIPGPMYSVTAFVNGYQEQTEGAAFSYVIKDGLPEFDSTAIANFAMVRLSLAPPQTISLPFEGVQVDLGTGTMSLSGTLNVMMALQPISISQTIVNLAFPSKGGDVCTSNIVRCQLAGNSAQQVDLSSGQAKVEIDKVKLTGKLDGQPAKNFVGSATFTIHSDGTISEFSLGPFNPLN